jgi:hypothetical protein
VLRSHPVDVVDSGKELVEDNWSIERHQDSSVLCQPRFTQVRLREPSTNRLQPIPKQSEAAKKYLSAVRGGAGISTRLAGLMKLSVGWLLIRVQLLCRFVDPSEVLLSSKRIKPKKQSKSMTS